MAVGMVTGIAADMAAATAFAAATGIAVATATGALAATVAVIEDLAEIVVADSRAAADSVATPWLEEASVVVGAAVDSAAAVAEVAFTVVAGATAAAADTANADANCSETVATPHPGVATFLPTTLYTDPMSAPLRLATLRDLPEICALIRASVDALQPEYTAAQRAAALRTVFTPDTRLIEDGTYFLALIDGEIAGCGGWSFRGTLYGGDHHVETADTTLLDPARDAAKIRAIFVHPRFARRGLGSLLLEAAESAALAAGFTRFEMGSTLAGVALYRERNYSEVSRFQVPVGGAETITVLRMTKPAPLRE